VKILLVGNGTRENRGCEAITVSTISLLRQYMPECEIEILSLNKNIDDYYESDYGIKVSNIKDEPLPMPYRIRQRIEQNAHLLPLSLRTILHTRLQPYVEKLETCDIVLSLGGDNYSDDYGLPIFFWDLALLARKQHKPFVIWGASVGPFGNGLSLKIARKALLSVSLITARENATVEYLKSIGANVSVVRVYDSAFTLPKKQTVMPVFNRNAPVVGFNISPIYHKYSGNNHDNISKTVQLFLDHVKKEFNVILVPHVMQNNIYNNDASYMSRFVGEHVIMADPGCDCQELKGIISRCDYFIGARTHATIAALSSTVPTLLLGYSLKAKGINDDFFDNEDIYIPSSDFCFDSLVAKFGNLVCKAEEYRQILKDKTADMEAKSRQAVVALSQLLEA